MAPFIAIFFNQEFWISFIAGFLSSLLVAIVIALVVFHYTNIFKQPNLVLVAKQDGSYSDKIKLVRIESGDYEARFWLAIKNSGNAPIKAGQGYWHVYLTGTSTTMGGPVSFFVAGEENHLRDYIQYPIYPHAFLDIGPEFRFVIKKENVGLVSIPYFFATDYGYFPKFTHLDSETGLVRLDKIGSLGVEVPE